MTSPALAPVAAPSAPARRRSLAVRVMAGLIRTYQRLMSWSSAGVALIAAGPAPNR